LLGSLWFKSFSASGGGAAAYELISTTVLGSSAASVTFSSLNTGVYKHLQIRITAKGSTATNNNLHMRFNSDSTAANYSYHELYGNGSSVGSGAGTSQGQISAIAFLPPSTSEFTVSIVDILDPFATTKNKTVRSFMGSNAGVYTQVALHSGAWFSTAAVTDLSIFSSTNIAAGSRFSIYGLR
jgi:hypothetical protein